METDDNMRGFSEGGKTAAQQDSVGGLGLFALLNNAPYLFMLAF